MCAPRKASHNFPQRRPTSSSYSRRAFLTSANLSRIRSENFVILPCLGAVGIKLLSGFYSAARHAALYAQRAHKLAEVAVYRLGMLERICKTMAQFRLSVEVEVGE